MAAAAYARQGRQRSARSRSARGTSCGSFDATLASGKCRTEDLNLGLGGTPIQPMPRELSSRDSCSYRWWKDALR